MSKVPPAKAVAPEPPVPPPMAPLLPVPPSPPPPPPPHVAPVLPVPPPGRARCYPVAREPRAFKDFRPGPISIFEIFESRKCVGYRITCRRHYDPAKPHLECGTASYMGATEDKLGAHEVVLRLKRWAIEGANPVVEGNLMKTYKKTTNLRDAHMSHGGSRLHDLASTNMQCASSEYTEELDEECSNIRLPGAGAIDGAAPGLA